MKILKIVIVSIVTVCVLVSMTLCFGACSTSNEDTATIDSVVISTARIPTSIVGTTVITETIAPSTRPKPTEKVTVVKTSKTELEEEGSEDINGSNSDSDNYSNDDDMDSNSDYMEPDVGSGAIYSPSEFQNAGVISWGGYDWTYYSELILPGYGLGIPGRHTTDDGYVCDGDGYAVLAADLSVLPRYSVVDTPFGYTGKVYDTGCAYGILDVYVGW